VWDIACEPMTEMEHKTRFIFLKRVLCFYD
jgi:hypothetical protein